MPTVGQEIINPVAGDAVRFLALPGEDRTDLVMEMKTVPAGQGPPVHIHPRSHETFTVVRGSIVVHENGREVVLHAGETHTVRPGVPHGFASHGDREAVTRVTMDRPGRMAEFLETYYELNRAGRFLADNVWTEIRSLVRITRIDQPEAMLIAPDQAFFLRENLKLRLLNARLAVLARQFGAAQSDLRWAQGAIERYFDRSSKRTQLAADQIRQVTLQLRQASIARPDDTLAALASAGAPR